MALTEHSFLLHIRETLPQLKLVFAHKIEFCLLLVPPPLQMPNAPLQVLVARPQGAQQAPQQQGQIVRTSTGQLLQVVAVLV